MHASVQRPRPQRPPAVQRQRHAQRGEHHRADVRDARLQRGHPGHLLDPPDHHVLRLPADRRRGGGQHAERDGGAAQPPARPARRPPPGVTLTTRTPSRSGAAAKSASVTPNGSHRLARSSANAVIARPFLRACEPPGRHAPSSP